MNSNATLMDTVDDAMQSVHASSATTARDKLEASMNAARASLRNGKDHVKTAARQAAGSTDQYVHTHPWSAVGIAAAAGAAIAVLLRSRMSR